MPEFTTEALIAVMRHAGDELKLRVAALVERTTQGLVADHRAKMPRSAGPGTSGAHLADRVDVRILNPLRQIVRSTSPALHLVELGTRERWDRTKRTPAFRGRMPKMGPVFVPLAQARRLDMLHEAEGLIGDREL